MIDKMKTKQAEAKQTMAFTQDVEKLEARLEQIAKDYDELADGWDSIDEPTQANQTRQEAMQVRNFAQQVSGLANLSAEDADHLIEQVKAYLQSIVHRTAPVP